MQNLARQGQTLTWRNTTADDVVSGQLVAVADVVGVAAVDIAIGARGALAMEGVYRLPKAAEAIIQGARVYLDANGAVTATAGDQPVGVAWEDAATAATVVMVKINV